MQLRFWGGWFLAIAGLAIMLSMGCEKGALGVKPAMVTGRVVKADNDTVGIDGATVRIMSKEAQGTSELKTGKNFLTTTTDANGYFVFENVVPDNILVEYAKGSNKGTYPSSTTTSQTDTGDTAESAKLQAVYIKSGAVVDLGKLPLAQSEGTLPSTVKLKLDLVNKTTLDRIDDTTRFIVTVNGVPLADEADNTSLTAKQLRDGIERASEQNLAIVVRHDDDNILYQTTTSLPVTVSGEEIYERIELTPVSYNLFLRCINVPDYININSSLVNVLAEKPSDGVKPPQILATQTITASTDNYVLPALISIPALSMPVDLRIQARGYEDELLKIDVANLPEGTQGNYRIDIDFLATNTVPATDPHLVYVPGTKAAMFDNIIRTTIVLAVAGPDLQTGNMVDATISHPNTSMYYINGSNNPNDNSSLPINNPVNIVFVGVPVGYNLSYNVTVYNAASGSFNIPSPEGGVMIQQKTEPDHPGWVFGVNAVRAN